MTDIQSPAQDRTGQDRQTTDRWHRANRFTNSRPKIGATGEQTIGNNHNSWVKGHGSRGSWVTWVMGQFNGGSDESWSQNVIHCHLP